MIIIILKNWKFSVCILDVNGLNQKCRFTDQVETEKRLGPDIRFRGDFEKHCGNGGHMDFHWEDHLP